MLNAQCSILNPGFAVEPRRQILRVAATARGAEHRALPPVGAGATVCTRAAGAVGRGGRSAHAPAGLGCRPGGTSRAVSAGCRPSAMAAADRGRTRQRACRAALGMYEPAGRTGAAVGKRDLALLVRP